MNNIIIDKKDAFSNFFNIEKQSKKTKNEKIDTKKNRDKNSINFIPSPRFEEYKNKIKK
tara:strand:- start:1623 stop:1799 length:177 start_codon:yes stop_codon:yes gene_type:complete